MNDVAVFLRQFTGTGAPVRTPQENIHHWIEVAKNPEQHTTETNPHAIAAVRRNARQNLRRLASRHPELIALMMRGEA